MKQIFVVINKVQQYSFNILACRKLCLYRADCNNERKKSRGESNKGHSNIFLFLSISWR